MNKIINTRIYLIIFLSTVILFVSYHLVIWFFFTSKIFDIKDDETIGEIARLSYQVDLLHNRKLTFTLKKSHLHLDNYLDKDIDIITIGDSFSHGGGGGPNPYYQDHIATLLNQNVLDIRKEAQYNSLETIMGLYNSGYLQKIKPKAIIIESVQRLIPSRYNKDLNYNLNINIPKISKKEFSVKHQNINIINIANYKIPYYFIKYKFKENASKDIYKFKLTKHLFSGNKGDHMLIYREDLKNIPLFNEQFIIKLNNQFNNIAKKLAKLNIKLYFMPAVDKYDLYYSYIKNNTHRKNNFFDIIRPLKKDYYFIDTKNILSKLLNNGVKDVYWIDDTHWSHVASEAISKNINKSYYLNR